MTEKERNQMCLLSLRRQQAFGFLFC
ncbi:hypothetical protein NC651_024029 [Populus alba x Populus x berolinensis]|nr:hypothetical protein NC651_024029 [Populus alba x Populus x berolinensis]